MTIRLVLVPITLFISLFLTVSSPLAQQADLILHRGKIVTVDAKFSIAEAVAVKSGRIVKVGSDREILQLKGPHTKAVDLGGKAVLPGLMDSHVHPADACLTEFDHPIPEMETIQDVLDYIQRRAAVVKEGEWIQLRQVFITRLREQRYPTKEELDRAAPKHPVAFSTGPDASEEGIQQYRELRRDGKLELRVALAQHIETIGPMEDIQRNMRRVAGDPLVKGGDWLKIIGIKAYLDGGMLTGSAYMLAPWGVSKIYSITDPQYRGVLFIPRERLLPIVKTTLESGLQFTAHTVGDGAVHSLLDVYEELNKTRPIKQNRPCITHSNFMSQDAVRKLAQLGVVVDIQPAWLYLDTRTLVGQFGYDRLRFFQPLRSIFEGGGIAGGGSVHMQKIGSLRSANPYNPFLAMWVTVTRQAKGYDGALHPEEALTREQAIRFYTRNNAYILFQEKQTGSLEAGKLADLIVLDTNILTCPVDDIRKTQVLQTYVAGKMVFERK